MIPFPFQAAGFGLVQRDGGSGPPVFTWDPSALADLVAWYAADEPLNTVVSTSILDTLYDKSGNGNHASKYSADNNNRARITSSALNSLPVWGYESSTLASYFRSTNSHVLAASNNKAGLTIYCVAAAVNNVTPPNVSVMVNVSSGSSDASARIQLSRGNSSQNAVNGGGRRLDGDSLVGVTDGVDYGIGYRVFGCVNNYASARSDVWVDGSAAGSNTSFHSSGNTSSTNSQALNIGATGASLNRNFGRTAEIVYASSALGTSDRQKLEGYLAWRWGLQGSLPGGHPYKSTPP